MKALTRATEKLLAPLHLQSRDRLQLALDKDGLRFNAKIYAINPYEEGKTTFASDAARSIFVQRVPERKKLDSTASAPDYWQFAATDTTVTLIVAIWPAEQIIFNDDETELTFKYLRATSAAADQNVEIVANFKENKRVPCREHLTVNWELNEIGDQIVPDLQLRPEWLIDIREEKPLAPYQYVAGICSMRTEGYGLFMEQGTGKTPVIIATVCNEAKKLRESGETRLYRALIIAPKNVRSNWVSEFEEFKTCPGKVTVLRGGMVNRIKLLIDALTTKNGELFTVVVVSYETMTRMIEQFRTIDWDRGVLDESHFIKAPNSKRSQAAIMLRDSCKARNCLTGTFIANTPLDVYNQFEFLGRGFSGFMSWKNFKQFYGVFTRTQQGDKLVALQNLPFMKERLAKLSFIISKKEALPDLPDKVYDVIEVTMGQKQRDAYEDLRKKLVLEAEQALDQADSNKALVIQNILTKMLRLAQITSGFISWDSKFNSDGDVLAREIDFFNPNPKLEALVEELKTKGPNDKTIVWATWVPDIKVITSRLAFEGIKAVCYYGGTSEDDRTAAVHDFNHDRDTKVFIGNPAAGGTGINLLGYPPNAGENYETNCNHVIYYSQDWSSPKRSQSEDRAHRKGTREPVRISDLCVAGTIDEEIRARVMKKRLTALEVGDVRAILRAVLKGVLDDE